MKLWRLEAFRGLAAVSVLLAHADSLTATNGAWQFGPWHAIGFQGTIGVQFFFTLSGFVMALSTPKGIGRTPEVGAFLWRRVCRIYPLFWVVLACTVWKYWGALAWPDVAAWASLLPIRTDNVVVVAWTLRQELVFYVMFALCLLPRVGRPVLILWIASVVLYAAFGPEPTPANGMLIVAHPANPLTLLFFAGLLGGSVLARLPHDGRLGALLALAGIAIVVARLPFDQWGRAYGPASATAIYGAGYACLLVGLAMLDRMPAHALRGGVRRAAEAAGALSYPLYLCHVLIIGSVTEWLGRTGLDVGTGLDVRIGPAACFATFVIAALVGGFVLAYGVDRPIQALLRGRVRPSIAGHVHRQTAGVG